MDNPSDERRSEQLDVNVALGERSYEIAIATDQMAQFADFLESWIGRLRGSSEIARSACIVTDTNVVDPHANRVRNSLEQAGWKCRLVTLEPGERTKSLSVISSLYDELVDMQADRSTIVVAVGGGVIGDAAGFTAASFLRGVPFVQVPTSLLAQVDSSVGGKVGVNHPQAKNLIGAFYQPLGVLIDTAVLQTLPERDYRSGLAEVVKYGVILDASFFQFLEENVADLNARTPAVLRHIVSRSCRLKADVVEQDEFERSGLRAVLNYGHTFGHAFEALCGYGELMHGEAVAIGMVYASRLAERMGLVGSDVTQRQCDLLQALHLPTCLPDKTTLSTDDVLERMKLDKKTVGGQLRFILPTRLGHVDTFKNVEEADVRAVMDVE